MGSQKVYDKDGFYIVRVRNGFIAVNGSKDFEHGHTHLRSYRSAICAVEYVKKRKVPKRCDIYFLTSLQRLAVDESYILEIEQLKEVRKQKGKKEVYFNVNKGS